MVEREGIKKKINALKKLVEKTFIELEEFAKIDEILKKKARDNTNELFNIPAERRIVEFNDFTEDPLGTFSNN